MKRHLFCALLVLEMINGSLVAADVIKTRRRPVAASVSADRRELFVANERSGTLSIIDLANRRVGRELPIGRSLVDVQAVGECILLLDHVGHELIGMTQTDSRWMVAFRLPVPKWPVRLHVDASGRRGVVASLWSRQLAFIDFGGFLSEGQGSPRVLRTLDLPFAPRVVAHLHGDSLLVTEALGGRFLVVDLADFTTGAVWELPGHAIRDAAVSNGRVYLTQQVLNPLARTNFDDLHWGQLLKNVVRELDVAALLDPRADPLTGSRLHRLGDVGRGASDPEGIARTSTGWIVSLSGVDEVCLASADWQRTKRLAVGRRPTAVVTDPDQHRAYVVNTLSDSVSVLDPHLERVVAEISLGPQPEPTATDRGERLFFNGRLSHDGWLSCQSCHTDGHTNNGVADTFGDGNFGAPKRVLPLGGVSDTNDWAWNGSVRELQEQMHKSVEGTMQGERLTPRQANDLVTYLFTLPSAPSVIDARGKRDDPEVREAMARGEQLFHRHGCAACHVPPLTYTMDGTFDVGLSDELGLRKFSPPSLRGVSQRDAFLHDGRVKALEDVFRQWGHQLPEGLSDAELDDLLTFLRSL